MNNTFTKAERINSKIVIDKLFAGGNPSMAAFPFRSVYMIETCSGNVPNQEEDVNRVESAGERIQPPVSVLISVPKKRFHNAVDRNRLKRLVREAYRTHKHALCDIAVCNSCHVYIAFVCISDEMPDYKRVEKSVVKTLARISEKICAGNQSRETAR